MDSNAKTVLEQCTHRSDNDTITFPEVVQKLAAIGAERYHNDLCRAERTYYMPDGESYVVAGARVKQTPAHDFSAKDLEAAVRAIQKQQITYGEFCERIAAAGCVGYYVSLAGRRAVYYGRTIDSYTEPFPTAVVMATRVSEPLAVS